MKSREEELQEIWDALDELNEINYIENSFRYYIDNDFNDGELDTTLKKIEKIF